MTPSKTNATAITALVVLTLSGCGGDGRPELVSAEGTITFNGAPLADAVVVFQVVEVEGDYNRPSQGTTDAQGNFRIGTYGSDDGIPVGTYKVAVTKREVFGDVDLGSEEVGSTPVRFTWAIPMKYGDPETSGLTVEVTSEGLEPGTITLEGTGGEKQIMGNVPQGA